MKSSDERFQESLAFGRIAETDIARWIKSRGSAILPVYAIENDEAYKGPRLFSADGDLVVPDLLVFNTTGLKWIEAKHKTVFSWFRKKRQWETGIDVRHYLQYLLVQAKTHVPVWLLFLHRCSTPDDCDKKYGCPAECPTGLYGNSLDVLSKCGRENSSWAGHLRYWAHADLIQLATLEEIRQLPSLN